MTLVPFKTFMFPFKAEVIQLLIKGNLVNILGLAGQWASVLTTEPGFAIEGKQPLTYVNEWAFLCSNKIPFTSGP